LPSAGVLVAVFLAVGSLIVDGVSSYVGLRETTNMVRLITGLASGFALPLLLFPVLNYQIWRQSSFKPVLQKVRQRVALVIVIMLIFAVVQNAQIFRIPLAAETISLLIVLSIFFTFAIINFILLTLLPFWYQRADGVAQLMLPFSLALAAAALELLLSSLAHMFLISLVV